MIIKKEKDGFTIIEMLAVIFIIGIVVATATPSATRMYQESKLNRRASEAIAYLREARQYAVTEQTTYGVYVYQSLNQFTLIHLVPDPANPGEFTEEVKSTFIVEDPLTISSSTIPDGQLITFNNVGNASQAGEIILADSHSRNRTICLNASGSTKLVIGTNCD